MYLIKRYFLFVIFHLKNYTWGKTGVYTHTHTHTSVHTHTSAHTRAHTHPYTRTHRVIDVVAARLAYFPLARVISIRTLL